MFLLFGIGIKAQAKGFGVSSNNAGERPSGKYDEIVNNGGKWIGKDEKTVYLTFDCGYENGYTKSMLETLKNYLVPNIDDIDSSCDKIMANYEVYRDGAYRCYKDIWHPKEYLEDIDEQLSSSIKIKYK